MRDVLKTEELDIPEGVEVTVKSRLVTVKGPRGTLSKNLRHADVDIRLVHGKANRVILSVWQGGRKHVAVLRTLRSLIVNMITGVTKVRKLRNVWTSIRFNAHPVFSPLGLPIQDARGIRSLPHQRYHPGERCEVGDPELLGREGAFTLRPSCALV